MVSSRDSAAGPSAAPALELVRKYNVPGPRYTSYPTAPQFTADFDRAALAAELGADNRDDAHPLSLYFHLPFCETLCWFCGCTTVITRRYDSAGEYVGWLERELALAAPGLNPRRPVTQLHFGGGSPTFLPPAEIRRLGDAIHRQFRFAADSENSVEVDPRRLTQDHVQAFRDLGCNRASLGVQDTNPEVQVAVHRVQPMDLNRRSVEWLRGAGYQSVSFDLIYGLPRQTPDSFARTIDEVLALNPDRFAIFSYAHVPWIKPSQKIFEQRQQLPSTEDKLAMMLGAIRQLTAAGYVHIGMDHFARANDELAVALANGTLHRNFQGYTTRAGASLYGFGMSAISQTDGSFRQNLKELPDYVAALAAGRPPLERGFLLSADDRQRRELIMRLMCRHRVDFAELAARTGVDPRQAFARELASLADLEADGLVRRDDTGLTITPLGELFRRIIAMRFDAYLDRGPRRFSKVV